MKIVVLTASEPLYLPAFFERFLSVRSDQVKAIFLTPPLYRKDSSRQMLGKYWSAFGTLNVVRLAGRVVWGKLIDGLRLSGRNGRCYSIARVAKRYGVRCEITRDVNDPSFLDCLRQIGVDMIVSVSCPQIFRRPLIELPPKGCLNMHGALLPEYRGLFPSFWMMVDGRNRAGVTVFLVNEDIDAGAVVAVDEFDILPDETLDQFIIRSKRIACDTLHRAIDLIESGAAKPVPLSKEGASYFGFPTREAYRRFCLRGRRLW